MVEADALGVFARGPASVPFSTVAAWFFGEVTLSEALDRLGWPAFAAVGVLGVLCEGSCGTSHS